MMFLSSSSFFLSAYLTKKIIAHEFSAKQFAYALKSNNLAALTLAERSAEVGGEDWLFFNRKLAKTQKKAALTLANWYIKRVNETDMLDADLAIMWFKQAIRLGSTSAVIALSQLYFEQGKVDKAEITLNLLANHSNLNKLNTHIVEKALLLRLKMAIYVGDTTQVKRLLTHEFPSKTNNIKLKELLIDIEKYGIVNVDVTKKKRKSNEHLNSLLLQPASCESSLQLFATNLKHLHHLENLIKDFKKNQPLSAYICINPPSYISKQLLDCAAKPERAISCDEALWQNIAKQVEAKHIGLLLESGGANVHLGIVYLDAKDNVDVFNHELSHLLGFIDEYPLTANHQICESVQNNNFAHNIAVLNSFYQGSRQKVREQVLKNIPWASHIDEDTPILQRISGDENDVNRWRLGTPLSHQDKFGIYLAETCQNSRQSEIARINTDSAFSAYKPVSITTQLRYFNEDFPQQYLTLLATNDKQYLMPSFHYNIALALYQKGQISEAKYWLEKSSQWETDPLKKKIILNGAF
ncbi:hypothetical protein [Colwellia echini]|uniref:Sel1 repeat family protein n=1 Tax=Colwellia echini TaxID=1982103 RepID=A0ABY3MUN4_9GAMM|nr:hypothetical protein [Colwellia echini]TYK64905.1 hypothetical protein CWS31_013135 [Colwellia echini]